MERVSGGMLWMSGGVIDIFYEWLLIIGGGLRYILRRRRLVDIFYGWMFLW